MPDEITLAPSERGLLLGLQLEALRYFLDNQLPSGLILDRQANHGPRRTTGWCSTAATGMGLIALALASAEPYRLLAPAEAIHRVRAALETALERLPHYQGVLPHFLDARTGEVSGQDTFSSVDSSWLVAGSLWAATFLRDPELEGLAGRLYDRVDWLAWSATEEGNKGLLHHARDVSGQFYPSCWDRLDGETIFMYVLGAGAAPQRALPRGCLAALKPFYGTVAGLRFNNADLGLFAFQYGLDLLDLARWRAPNTIDLAGEARLATRANYLFCREQAATFATYRHYWGLSDGDGPGQAPGTSEYRVYGPGQRLDGTAHLAAALAGVAHAPAEVLECLGRAERDQALRPWGRYGPSNINLDRSWVGRDVVGIDAGAIVLALDNYLMADRVRRAFHALPCVAQGLGRLGFTA